MGSATAKSRRSSAALSIPSKPACSTPAASSRGCSPERRKIGCEAGMNQVIEHDPHRETEELLPWYVTGRLHEHEREAVERHVAGCAHCEKQLRLERRLAEEFRATTPGV